MRRTFIERPLLFLFLILFEVLYQFYLHYHVFFEKVLPQKLHCKMQKLYIISSVSLFIFHLIYSCVRVHVTENKFINFKFSIYHEYSSFDSMKLHFHVTLLQFS